MRQSLHEVRRELSRYVHRRRGRAEEVCAWCCRWVSARAERESRRLGLDAEFCFACRGCLAGRAYLAAPDGWDDEEQWIFARD